MELIGNTPAKKVLSSSCIPTHGKPFPDKGYFDQRHLIACGLNNLFEGDTVCYPKALPAKSPLKVFARSTDDHPVICYAEHGSGRLMVDAGFTKLWVEWNSAGKFV